MDDQHKMIKEEKIDIEIIHGIYPKKTNNKKEKVILIQKKDIIIQTSLDKQINIRQFVKITIDGKSKIYEIPNKETKTVKKNNSIVGEKEKIISPNKKRILTPFKK